MPHIDVERDSAVLAYLATCTDLFRHADEVVRCIYYKRTTVFVETYSPSHKAVLGYELFVTLDGTVGGRTGRNATFCLVCDYYRPATLQENNDANL